MNGELDFLNYSASAKLAEKIRKKTKVGSDKWLKSTFALALSLHQRQPDVKSEKLRAEKLYNELIKNSEGKIIQAKAMILLARMASERDYLNDKSDNSKAKRLYSEVIKKFPNTQVSDMAALFKAHLYVFSTNKEEIIEGINFTKEWLKKRPTNVFASLQYSLISDRYYRYFNDPKRAVEYSLEAERAGLPPLIQLDHFYWNVANKAELAGMTNLAVKYYKKVITDVVSSGFAYESQMRLRELGVEPPKLIDPFAVQEK